MFNLSKTPEPLTDVTSIQFGVAWKTSAGHSKGIVGWAKKKIGADLDAFAVALSAGEAKGMCGFDDPDVFDDGSLISHGDSRTGRGSGDDESITAHLTKLPPYIDTVVLVVAAYKEGVTFDKVTGICMSLYDLGIGMTKISETRPNIDATGNAAVVAAVTRSGAGWTIREINQLGNARDRRALINLAKSHATS